jgi:hypothetical protein
MLIFSVLEDQNEYCLTKYSNLTFSFHPTKELTNEKEYVDTLLAYNYNTFFKTLSMRKAEI